MQNDVYCVVIHRFHGTLCGECTALTSATRTQGPIQKIIPAHWHYVKAEVELIDGQIVVPGVILKHP